MSIAITSEQSDLDELIQRRKRLIEQRRGIDHELYMLERSLSFNQPSRPRTAPGRNLPINSSPLFWVVYDTIKESGPIALSDITQRVLASGYKTKSPTDASFSACVEKAIARLVHAQVLSRELRLFQVVPGLSQQEVERRLESRRREAV